MQCDDSCVESLCVFELLAEKVRLAINLAEPWDSAF